VPPSSGEAKSNPEDGVTQSCFAKTFGPLYQTTCGGKPEDQNVIVISV